MLKILSYSKLDQNQAYLDTFLFESNSNESFKKLWSTSYPHVINPIQEILGQTLQMTAEGCSYYNV